MVAWTEIGKLILVTVTNETCTNLIDGQHNAVLTGGPHNDASGNIVYAECYSYRKH